MVFQTPGRNCFKTLEKRGEKKKEKEKFGSQRKKKRNLSTRWRPQVIWRYSKRTAMDSPVIINRRSSIWKWRCATKHKTCVVFKRNEMNSTPKVKTTSQSHLAPSSLLPFPLKYWHVLSSETVERRIATSSRARILCWRSDQTNGEIQSSCQSQPGRKICRRCRQNDWYYQVLT